VLDLEVRLQTSVVLRRHVRLLSNAPVGAVRVPLYRGANWLYIA
jgi:hypothetical protein